MSRVAEQAIEDIESILHKKGGLTSLKNIVEILGDKWNLKNDEKSASTLESLGFAVSYIRDGYYIGF
jgi:hypothetical protein